MSKLLLFLEALMTVEDPNKVMEEIEDPSGLTDDESVESDDEE